MAFGRECRNHSNSKAVLFYGMPNTLINHLLLHEVGTNQLSIRFEENKVWITAIDRGNPQESFWALTHADWEAMKNFIDYNFKTNIK